MGLTLTHFLVQIMVIILDGNLDGKKLRTHKEQSLLFDLFKTSKAVKNTHFLPKRHIFLYARAKYSELTSDIGKCHGPNS